MTLVLPDAPAATAVMVTPDDAATVAVRSGSGGEGGTVAALAVLHASATVDDAVCAVLQDMDVWLRVSRFLHACLARCCV